MYDAFPHAFRAFLHVFERIARVCRGSAPLASAHTRVSRTMIVNDGAVFVKNEQSVGRYTSGMASVRRL